MSVGKYRDLVPFAAKVALNTHADSVPVPVPRPQQSAMVKATDLQGGDRVRINGVAVVVDYIIVTGDRVTVHAHGVVYAGYTILAPVPLSRVFVRCG